MVKAEIYRMLQIMPDPCDIFIKGAPKNAPGGAWAARGMVARTYLAHNVAEICDENKIRMLA